VGGVVRDRGFLAHPWQDGGGRTTQACLGRLAAKCHFQFCHAVHGHHRKALVRTFIGPFLVNLPRGKAGQGDFVNRIK